MERRQEKSSIPPWVIIAAVVLVLITLGAGSIFLFRRIGPDEPSDIFLIEGEDYFDDEFE